ncbi:cytosol aminopeptidase-like [Drosophila miranda]|uniref:cytosol aminopeptidase-like n=1 Tax=Drosophila miranda TaxID=7229 RepID=UPI00143F6E6D|nr:cytosol aminopeptidase-like [Drosophila miranda]
MNVDAEFRAVAVVGVGQEGAGFNDLEMIDEGMENARVAAGVGARALQLQGCTDVFVESMEYAEQAAEESALAVWRYNTNKRRRDRTLIPKLELYDSPYSDAWMQGRIAEPGPSPGRYAGQSDDAHNLRPVNGGCPVPLLGIRGGTQHGLDRDKPILLLGKGITFNSGGLCLRPKDCLSMYRGCMSGAAACVGVIRAAAALSLPLNITALLPLGENMPSGMAAKPGDVVSLLNGKTLGFVDVSKAGVMAMADPLLYAQTIYKPRMVVDIATVGYAVCPALGGAAAGIFSNSNFVYKQFEKAGALTGDRVWRLPLWRYFKELIMPNETLDISNRGRGPASSCIAAAVLHELVPCVDWAHLDIRNVGMLTSYNPLPYLLKDRMTGRPTRTIVQAGPDGNLLAFVGAAEPFCEASFAQFEELSLNKRMEVVDKNEEATEEDDIDVELRILWGSWTH